MFPFFVIPAKAGIHNHAGRGRADTSASMDSRLRGNDEKEHVRQFRTTVTARRFWAQADSSEPSATGRSLP